MAAKVFYLTSFLLLLFNLISSDALERRFSDLKRCADEECSMLLCRGKAVSDFSGPDCRFLSFKKSETIYVYYKLSGQRADVWAGSVGSRFGYFPKDLLAVNHIYTDKELEVSTEETDFVCFDTGFDKFDNYDIDSLLGSSLMGKNDRENTDTIDQSDKAEGTTDETELSTEEATENENQEDHETELSTEEVTENENQEDHETELATEEATENENQEDHETELSTEEATETESHEDDDDPQDLDLVPGDQSASLPQLDKTTESFSPEAVESDAGAEPDAAKNAVEDTESEQQTTGDLALGSDNSEQSETKDIPSTPEDEPLSKDDADSEKEFDSFSEGRSVPELKTTLGETFDAVTTDDEDTWKVTPYEEEESEELEDYIDDSNSDSQKDTLLLSFSEEKAADAPESDPLNKDQSPSTTHDQQASEDKNLWTSFGDTVFAIVSGGERTADVSSSEEDEDEDDEGEVEEDIAPNPQSTEEPNEEEAQVLVAELSKEPEASEEIPFEDPSKKNALEAGDEMGDNDSGPLMFDDDDDNEVAGRGNDDDKASTLPTDEQSSDKKTEEGTAALELVSSDDNPVDLQPHKLKSKTLDESTEEQVSKESEFQDDNAHGNNTFDHHREELISKSEDNKTTNGYQELPVKEIEPKKHLPYEEEKSKDSEFKDHDEQNEDTNTLIQYHKHSITDIEKNVSKHSHQELPGEETELNEHIFEEEEASKGSETEEEEREELLEDENAVFSGHKHTSHSDTDIPSLDTSEQPPSTSEPEYSDSVLRLTLLREHFEEEDMERLQRVLGLKNLFRVEAMFSDLDTELKATRHSQTSTAEDVEKSLEAILEASETPILDEIERMLDSRDLKGVDLHQMHTSMFDEEAAILDDFQELAFSLRQKYSAASDSAPLAADSPSHIEQDEHISDVEEEEEVVSHTLEDKHDGSLTEGTERDDNLTATDVEEKPPEREEKQPVLDVVHKRPDISLEEDGGHFNKNEDNLLL